jgi:hypothetical protein
MKYRKLRIAFSAVCSLLCLLLIAFWVRSYWHWESVVWGMTPKTGYLAQSQSGRCLVTYLDVSALPASLNATLYEWKYQHFGRGGTGPLPGSTFAGFTFLTTPKFAVGIPYWFPAGALVVLTVAPWLRHIGCRFSLRTLLIATTLVAVGLGLIVASSH